ncbi:glycosyltransferase [Thermodesulforhabdus norvegica]|uniref:Glycosyl transferase family 2 n=1 Tax=Thermodesulforhabdus norvegica TaxID=39841 RepID=A0A1I4SRA8_9BACT|nr:glycosyltransferase [Thermodesulforhabdus norvegica]SFM66919.1 Glycosyl transferase family 2 [Thermodesulforhabdus norvegica]
MNTTIPVSVIIPAYNRARFLVEAIKSVLAQKFVRPLEIIVVDDGSTDETSRVVDSFIPQITYFYQEHSGVSSARNRGICISSGEWIAFLDSDDLWKPEKLFRHWAFILANPHLLISQTEEIWIRKGRRVNPRKYHKKPEGLCFERLLERCLISPSAVMIHRKLFDEVGLFDENLPACEDYDLWLRIGCRHPVGLLKEPLVIKRGGHEDQLSSSVPALDRYRIQAIVKLLIKEPLSKGQRQEALKMLEKKCRIYAAGCAKRGRTEEARFYLSLPEVFADSREQPLRPELSHIEFVAGTNIPPLNRAR